MKIKPVYAFLIALVVVIIVVALIVRRSPAPLTSPVVHKEHAGNPTLYPDLQISPGSVDPAVTQDNLNTTICSPGYTKTVRPSSRALQKVRDNLMAEYHRPGSPRDYELDHIIPLELGGCPDCPTNLWPEPYAPSPGAREKDRVENYLHRQVCKGAISLKEAQSQIVADWYSVYIGISH